MTTQELKEFVLEELTKIERGCIDRFTKENIWDLQRRLKALWCLPVPETTANIQAKITNGKYEGFGAAARSPDVPATATDLIPISPEL
jgi:hypothetical protein